jgi:hypothetical protein
MDFLQTSYGLLANFLWTSCKLPLNFLQTSCKLIMNFFQNFLWTSRKLPTFWCTYYFATIYFLRTSHTLLLCFLHTTSVLLLHFKSAIPYHLIGASYKQLTYFCDFLHCMYFLCAYLLNHTNYKQSCIL